MNLQQSTQQHLWENPKNLAVTLKVKSTLLTTHNLIKSEQLLEISCLIANGFYWEALKKINEVDQLKLCNYSSRFQISKNKLHAFKAICLYFTRQQHQAQLKKIQQNEELKNQVKKLLETPSNIMKRQNLQKLSEGLLQPKIRQEYEKLLRKAQYVQYYKRQGMPVYLISTKWLQRTLFASAEGFEQENNLQMHYLQQPIDNRDLIKTVQLVDNDQKIGHYQYYVPENIKQNSDYKLIPYECWRYLYEIYGGIEVLRYITPEKPATVEISYRKLNVMVIQGLFIHKYKMELYVSRYDTLDHLKRRIKRLLILYHFCNFEVMKAPWQMILSRNYSNEQFAQWLQWQQSRKDQFLSELEQLDDDKDTINDAAIYSQTDLIVVNILTPHIDNLFKKIPKIKITGQKSKCLTCHKRSDLFDCSCNTVKFCSKNCQKSNTAHTKQCKLMMKQQSNLRDLLYTYNPGSRILKQIDIRRQGFVGFQNLGNTCYLNAALQCVMRIDDIVQFFLKNQHVKDVNTTNVLGTEGSLAFAFGEFVKDYFSTNKRSLKPLSILKIIARNPQFQGHNHQDSQQFLNYFLDKLHEDLNRVKKKPYLEDVESNGRPDQVVSQESWNNFLQRNKSFIAEKLAGQYRSQIKCPDCGKISITFDPFMSVTLPFPKKQPMTEISGYIMMKNGAFRLVETEVLAKKKTGQVLKQIFPMNVCAVAINNKRVKNDLKSQKNILKNIKEEKLILFYEIPENCPIKIDIVILNKKNQAQSFNRRIYLSEVQNQQNLLIAIYQVIRHPFLKCINKIKRFQDQDEKYLSFCKQNQIVQIVTTLEYPFNQTDYTIEIKLVQKKLKWEEQDQQGFEVDFQPNNVKYNVSSGQYQDLVEDLTDRKWMKKQLTMNQLIKCFSQPQQLTQQNAWYCNVCKDHKLAQKIMSIYKLPQYLIIHLKRFNHSGNRYVIYGEKVNTSVKLDEIQEINGNKYEMIGIVNHFGSLTFGHYTAYVNKSQWLYFDDSSVRKGRASGDNAYLVFYKQIKQ